MRSSRCGPSPETCAGRTEAASGHDKFPVNTSTKTVMMTIMPIHATAASAHGFIIALRFTIAPSRAEPVPIPAQDHGGLHHAEAREVLTLREPIERLPDVGPLLAGREPNRLKRRVGTISAMNSRTARLGLDLRFGIYSQAIPSPSRSRSYGSSPTTSTYPV